MTKETMFNDEIEHLFKVYIKKNSDYGDSFSKLYDKFGMKSVLIRLFDKLYRLESLEENERKVKDESATDTLEDMAIYCIMSVVERRYKEVENENRG